MEMLSGNHLWLETGLTVLPAVLGDLLAPGRCHLNVWPSWKDLVPFVGGTMPLGKL